MDQILYEEDNHLFYLKSKVFFQYFAYLRPDGVPYGGKGGKKLLNVFGFDIFYIKIVNPAEKRNNQFLKSAGIHHIPPYSFL